jgi:MFS family permease
MTNDTTDAQNAGVWITFSEAPIAAKTILVGVFLNRLSGFLNIFLVLFLTKQGYSVGESAIAIGVFGAGSVVSYLVGGVFAERLGPRNLSAISMASSAVLLVALLYLPGFGLLVGAVALAGVASQLWWPSSATLLSDLTAENRQVMILAMYRFAVNVGSSAAPLIGVLLYNLNHQQYTIAFWVQATVGVGYGVLSYLVLPKRRPHVDAAGDDTAHAVKVTAGYLTVLRDRRFVLYLAAAFFYTAVYMQYLSTLPLDVQASGLPVFWYTVVVSLNGLVVIALELPLTKVVQKLPRRLTVCVAFTLVGLGMGTYGLPLAPIVVVVGTIIWTCGEMVGAPSVFAYPAIAGPARLKTYYISTFQFVFGAATAIGMSVGVALFGWLGHRVWTVVALGAVLSVVFAFFGLGKPLAGDQPKTPEQTSADGASAAAEARDKQAVETQVAAHSTMS